MKTRIVLPTTERITTAIAKTALDKARAAKPDGVSLQLYLSSLVEQALEQQQAS